LKALLSAAASAFVVSATSAQATVAIIDFQDAGDAGSSYAILTPGYGEAGSGVIGVDGANKYIMPVGSLFFGPGQGFLLPDGTHTANHSILKSFDIYLATGDSVFFHGAQIDLPRDTWQHFDVWMGLAWGYQVDFVGLGGSPSKSLIDNIVVDRVTIPNYVPEPSTWAFMILGLGATGAALRRRRLQAAS
jgi:hypothetical protein